MSDKEIKLIENQSYEPRQPEPDLYIEKFPKFECPDKNMLRPRL